MKIRKIIPKPGFQGRYRLFYLITIVTCLISLAVSGQTIPRRPNCTETPLHPVAGKAYTYSVNIPAPFGAPQSFDWYVTDNPSFITGSTAVTSGIVPNNKEYLEAGNGYHNPAAGTSSISIKWTGKAVTSSKTKPYFLVIRYKGTNGILCEAMNLRVYKIDPYNAFTLDLTNVSGTTDLGLNGSNQAVVHQHCAGEIVSVNFDGTKMIYDYGSSELLFKVVATNFSGGWKPSVKISGLSARQTVGTIEWSETPTFAGANPFSKSNDIWTPANKVSVPADHSTQEGAAIYIRVVIRNNDFEGTTDTPVTLAINGVTDDGEEDVHYADCLPDGYANDVATQTILARPAITSNTGSPVQNFIP